MELKDVVDKKIAVACETKEELYDLQEYMCSVYPNFRKYPFEDNFEKCMRKNGSVAFRFGSYTYEGILYGVAGYCPCEWYPYLKYKVVSFRDLVKKQEPKEQTIEIPFDEII